MTTQELNRDIKRLWVAIEKTKDIPSEEYFKFINHTARPEFIRLYDADKSMQAMTKRSILRMLKINMGYRFVPLHQFYPH